MNRERLIEAIKAHDPDGKGLQRVLDAIRLRNYCKDQGGYYDCGGQQRKTIWVRNQFYTLLNFAWEASYVGYFNYTKTGFATTLEHSYRDVIKWYDSHNTDEEAIKALQTLLTGEESPKEKKMARKVYPAPTKEELETFIGSVTKNYYNAWTKEGALKKLLKAAKEGKVGTSPSTLLFNFTWGNPAVEKMTREWSAYADYWEGTRFNKDLYNKIRLWNLNTRKAEVNETLVKLLEGAPVKGGVPTKEELLELLDSVKSTAAGGSCNKDLAVERVIEAAKAGKITNKRGQDSLLHYAWSPGAYAMWAFNREQDNLAGNDFPSKETYQKIFDWMTTDKNINQTVLEILGESQEEVPEKKEEGWKPNLKDLETLLDAVKRTSEFGGITLEKSKGWLFTALQNGKGVGDLTSPDFFLNYAWSPARAGGKWSFGPNVTRMNQQDLPVEIYKKFYTWVNRATKEVVKETLLSLLEEKNPRPTTEELVKLVSSITAYRSAEEALSKLYNHAKKGELYNTGSKFPLAYAWARVGDENNWTFWGEASVVNNKSYPKEPYLKLWNWVTNNTREVVNQGIAELLEDVVNKKAPEKKEEYPIKGLNLTKDQLTNLVNEFGRGSGVAKLVTACIKHLKKEIFFNNTSERNPLCYAWGTVEEPIPLRDTATEVRNQRIDFLNEYKVYTAWRKETAADQMANDLLSVFAPEKVEETKVTYTIPEFPVTKEEFIALIEEHGNVDNVIGAARKQLKTDQRLFGNDPLLHAISYAWGTVEKPVYVMDAYTSFKDKKIQNLETYNKLTNFRRNTNGKDMARKLLQLLEVPEEERVEVIPGLTKQELKDLFEDFGDKNSIKRVVNAAKREKIYSNDSSHPLIYAWKVTETLPYYPNSLFRGRSLKNYTHYNAYKNWWPSVSGSTIRKKMLELFEQDVVEETSIPGKNPLPITKGQLVTLLELYSEDGKGVERVIEGAKNTLAGASSWSLQKTGQETLFSLAWNPERKRNNYYFTAGTTLHRQHSRIFASPNYQVVWDWVQKFENNKELAEAILSILDTSPGKVEEEKSLKNLASKYLEVEEYVGFY